MILNNNISKSYGNNIILNNISLAINSGEITFIIGSSGAGKSTLLNIIGGLDNVDSGNIYYNGEDITKNLSLYRAQNVGFIFQDYNLINGLSVRENIELGMLYSGKKTDNIPVDEQIDQLGIKDRHQTVETLSGGEKQRVAIIRSICKKSNIILADEPTGNLDSVNSELVFEMLSEMKRDKHIVVVSHDLDMANKYADRIITLKDGAIVSDTKPTTESSEITAVKSPAQTRHNICWKSVFMLGLNSVKLRLSKIVLISIVCALAISALAMVFDFNNLGNSVSANVNINYLEVDQMSLYYLRSGNLFFKEVPFDKSDIENIQDKYNTKEIVPIYMENNGIWLFSNDTSTQEANIRQININDFFKERVMSNDIEGSFPQNKDEIILASDIAKALFTDSCIGKELTLNSGNGESVTMKIVGINNTVNPFDEIYSYVSSLKIKELLEAELSNTLHNRLELDKFLSEEELDYDVIVTSGGIYGSMQAVQGDETLIYGNLPKNKNEIMISSFSLQYALQGFDIPYESSESDILAGKLPDDVLNQLFNTKMALKHNGLFELFICGVYESDDVELRELRFPTELIKDLQAEVRPTILDVYLPPDVNITEIKDTIISNEEYTADTRLDYLKFSIINQTTFFKWALILLGIIMIFISTAMLSSFSKIAVLERKKEVATIKSLGAGNKDVLFTLWFDSVVISSLAFIVSLLIIGVFVFIFPHVMPDMSFLNYKYPLAVLCITALCFLVYVCIYTYLSLRKLIKKTPAQLFSN